MPWGEKAFGAYLGGDRSQWAEWDACELIAQASERLPIRIDQGLNDPFLERELQPERIERACAEAGHPLELRRHDGHDHSYYFVASFIGEHIAYHACALGLGP